MMRHRLVDWRLVAALAFLMLVAFVVWSGINSAHRADDALATMQQHDQGAQRDRDEAAQDRAAATRNQQALLDYTATLAARQDALLAYLRAHGIHLPQRLVTVVPPPRIVVRHPRATHHVKRRSTSSTTPPPSGPGKSGHAPGHHKHRRHGHRHR